MINGKKKVLVLNGPNLNLLGVREPEIYGYSTLADIETAAKKQAADAGAELDFFQTNWEGAMIDRIHAARTDGTDGIVLNPAGWTHYGVPLRDAMLASAVPFVELHIGNYIGREAWRLQSQFRDVATSVIVGCGIHGYRYAIDIVLTDDGKFPRKASA